MHLSLFGLAMLAAMALRWGWRPGSGAWGDRWQCTLMTFLLPMLLLGSTAIAVLWMGHHGHMLGHSVDRLGCLLAWGLCAGAIGLLGLVSWQGWRSLHYIRLYPGWSHGEVEGRLLDSTDLYAAQVGFWTPELVVSRGLVESLAPEHLEAVLHHETAHAYYHDTFWFFWLGWVRRLTAWLPATDELWQELLFLRELRADQWAAQVVDPLVLAEALLAVARSPLPSDDLTVAAFNDQDSVARLEERINALLAPPSHPATPTPLPWLGLAVGLLPLVTVLLHR